MARIRCEIRYHRGIEQQDLQDSGDPYESLLLRISCQLAHSEAEVQLHGRWAAALQTLGPGDMLLIEGAQEAEPHCFSVHGVEPALTVYRDGFHFKVDEKVLKDISLPDWLQPPPAKKVGGFYKYHRWLCTLRDGTDANLWAVVWENGRQGPSIRDGFARCGFTVVDPSFEHMAASEWSTNTELPLYTLFTSLQSNKAALSFEL